MKKLLYLMLLTVVACEKPIIPSENESTSKGNIILHFSPYLQSNFTRSAANVTNALLQKRLSLNMDDCPWEEEYKQGYKEGWYNAFMYAEQIIEELLNKK